MPLLLSAAQDVLGMGSDAATAALVGVGGIAAFWKFVLQAPFGNHYAVDLSPCRIRKINSDPDEWVYTLTLTVTNRSAARQHIRGWWRRIRFPKDVPADYNPDGSLDILSPAEATAYFNEDSRIDDYPLASGEKYSDQLVSSPRTRPLAEICYVEFCLCYKRWGRVWGILRRREDECLRQIMIAPVEREDLTTIALGRDP